MLSYGSSDLSVKYALDILKNNPDILNENFIKNFYRTLKNKNTDINVKNSFYAFLEFLIKEKTILSKEQIEIFLHLFFTDKIFIDKLTKNPLLFPKILNKYEFFFKRNEIKEHIKNVDFYSYLLIYVNNYGSVGKDEIEKIIDDKKQLQSLMKFYFLDPPILREIFLKNNEIFMKFCENLLKWNDYALIEKYKYFISSVHEEIIKKGIKNEKLDKLVLEISKT